MPEFLAITAGLSLLIWAILLLGRRGFWRANRFLPAERANAEPVAAPVGGWPPVLAVVPARDEAAVIAETVAALCAQDYPGRFGVIIVDADRFTNGCSPPLSPPIHWK